MKKKIGMIAAGVVGVLLVAGAICSVVLGIKMSDKLDKMERANIELQKTVEEVLSMGEDVAQEDDVVIAGEYTIKSTKHISDAYISGDDSKLSDRDKETLKMASDIIDEIIKDGMSDYEKELAVYEWLTMYTSQDTGMLVALPTTNADSDTPYGVLKNKTAICVGYATTFRLFMQMLDIDCKVVHSSDLGHSWNLVKLDDEWYHTDVYSDAGMANYSNFNMNDATYDGAYGWNTSYFPAATGVKYSYAYQNKEEIQDVYAIPAKIKEMIDAKEKSVFISLGKKSENSDLNYMIAESIISKISGRLEMGDLGNMWLDWSWNVLGDEEEYVLCVFLNISEESVYNENITEELQKKINKALNKAFGKYDWDMLYDMGY